MGRSGYVDDCENLWLYRGAVARAMNGRRGQDFLREMLTALDALLEQRLIADELADEDGAVCALGAVGKLRGFDMSGIEMDDTASIAEMFGIAESMVREIAFENDQDFSFRDETPELRFARMRKWVVENIISPPSEQEG